MKLYKVWQDVVDGYDTFSDMVVCASSAEEARCMHPYDANYPDLNNWESSNDTWCPNVSDAHVEYLGEARWDLVKGVICTSFHAG